MERGLLRRVPSVPAPTMRRSGSDPAILVDIAEQEMLRPEEGLLVSDGTAFEEAARTRRPLRVQKQVSEENNLEIRGKAGAMGESLGDLVRRGDAANEATDDMLPRRPTERRKTLAIIGDVKNASCDL